MSANGKTRINANWDSSEPAYRQAGPGKKKEAVCL